MDGDGDGDANMDDTDGGHRDTVDMARLNALAFGDATANTEAGVKARETLIAHLLKGAGLAQSDVNALSVHARSSRVRVKAERDQLNALEAELGISRNEVGEALDSGAGVAGSGAGRKSGKVKKEEGVPDLSPGSSSGSTTGGHDIDMSDAATSSMKVADLIREFNLSAEDINSGGGVPKHIRDANSMFGGAASSLEAV